MSQQFKLLAVLIGVLVLLGCKEDKRQKYTNRVLANSNSLYNQLERSFGGVAASPELRTYFSNITAKQKPKWKMVILTDEPGAKRAKEIVAAFGKEAPWALFKMDFEIVQKTSAELGCKEGATIKRLIEADRGLASREASNRGGDQAMIVCNLAYGGSGGDIPVVAANSEAVPTAFHEFMHSLGFGDEYMYSEDEAKIYCKNENAVKDSNLAFIEPDPSYADDGAARHKHSHAIPWYGHIMATTPLINSNALGTPSSHQDQFGLFPSSTCKKRNPPFRLWKPGGRTSIMEETNPSMRLNNIYATLVFDILVDRGVPLKELPAGVTTEVEVNNDNRTGSGGGATGEGTPAAPLESSGH